MAQIPLARGAGRMAHQVQASSRTIRLAVFTRSFLARPSASVTYRTAALPTTRFMSTTRPLFKGILPETDDPPASDPEPHATASAPTELTMEEYHRVSDQYLEKLVDKFEAMAEEKEEIDCEYSAGILTINTRGGTYILNKQPPNKQIWLSAPESGPKRYDFVMESEGQDAKEGTGSGQWVYLRDGSNLSDLLQTEIGVDISGL